MTNREIAEAFSGHRFTETYEHLADGIVWNLVGEAQLEGRDAVIAACEGTAAENADVATSWLRFVTTADGPVVAVDAVGVYTGRAGVSAVSSCDIYEFVDGRLAAITSYAVEVNPDAPYSPQVPVADAD